MMSVGRVRIVPSAGGMTGAGDGVGAGEVTTGTGLLLVVDEAGPGESSWARIKVELRLGNPSVPCL